LEEKVIFIVMSMRTSKILDNFIIPVKGISFFGPKSEYIVSGSDCGNIYFWDKGTESIVQWLVGDENGVVRIRVRVLYPCISTFLEGLDQFVTLVCFKVTFKIPAASTFYP
jgi:WD40 repeat protein